MRAATTSQLFLLVIVLASIQRLSNAQVTEPRLFLFCFQKDEVNLLPEWLAHHLDVVGNASRIFLIDHASQARPVWQVLEAFRRMGGHVMHFGGSFQNKHAIMTRAMRSVAARSQPRSGDLLLPLDVDEFLFAGQLETSPAAIAAQLRLVLPVLQSSGAKAKLRMAVAHRCAREDGEHRRVFGAIHLSPLGKFNPTSPTRNCLAKTLFLANTFIAVDQGAHFGTTSKDRNCSPSDPVYSSICHACFHKIDLGVVHYGVPSALTVEEYEGKLARYAREYSSKCVGKHKPHYCNFLDDPSAVMAAQRGRRESACARSKVNLVIAQAVNSSSAYMKFREAVTVRDTAHLINA